MTDNNRRCVRLRRIALARLTGRSDHPYRLSPRVRRALAEQIAATGLYPPLIVRPHGSAPGRFEILDGRQRAEILAELGRTDARCEVWPVDDAQAEVLAATLNHLHSRAEAASLARQIRRLIDAFGPDRTGRMLALSPAGIRQRLAALDPPRPAAPDQEGMDLRAVTFHLNPGQLELLRGTLRRYARSWPHRADQLTAAITAAAGTAAAADNAADDAAPAVAPSRPGRARPRKE